MLFARKRIKSSTCFEERPMRPFWGKDWKCSVPQQRATNCCDMQRSSIERLRASEFADLYSECGHEVLLWKPDVDEPSRRALANGFPLHSRFQSYSPDTLSTVVLQVLSRPQKR